MTNKTTIDKEESFHDKWSEDINVHNVLVTEFFESITSPENKWIMSKLGNVKDKRILELGCGSGEASVYFATKGAQVIATDISDGMLNMAGQVAKMHGVSIETRKISSQRIDFDDQSFDIIYAANVLHHVDLDATLREVSRTLKTGGIFVSWDPLAHNPLINIYRRIAKDVRTEDEHPLTMRDVKLFKNHFLRVETHTTWFFTLWIFVRFFLIERIDPNKERYWKKILTDCKRLEKTYRRLERLDKLFLELFPFMRRYCWNIVTFCVK